MPRPQTKVNENQNPCADIQQKVTITINTVSAERKSKEGQPVPAFPICPNTTTTTEEIENNSCKEIAAPQFLPETASFLNPTKSTAQSHISRKNRRIPFSELLHVRYWEENSGWKITVDNSTGRSFRQAPISAWRFQLSTTCAHRRRR